MTKQTILYLAACPVGRPLDLAEEVRAIQDELDRSHHGDRFDFQPRWAARPSDLLRHLRRLRPTIVHFSGHGEEDGLYFQRDDGSPQLVSADAIARTFGVAGASVQLVVLNTCYSDTQSTALRAHINCVVGVRGALADDSARSFAVGLYGALGARASVQAAFEQGCVAAQLDGHEDAVTLEVHPGFDADTLVLADIALIANLDLDRTANRADDEPPPPAVDYCPYPGLASFGPGDADIFCGRKQAIDELEVAVAGRNLTLLLGASGSGKSSVVLAGLAPRLHRTSGWRFAYVRIGLEAAHDPFAALARAMLSLRADPADDQTRDQQIAALAAELRTGARSIAHALAEILPAGQPGCVLLIADQFEEVFSLIPDVAVQWAFIDRLLAAAPAGAPQSSFRLVVTLRADFYGRALTYRPLADRLADQVRLPAMTHSELEEAIRAPAARHGVTFDSAVVTGLLDALDRSPGTLPLLQFTLRQLWLRRAGATISMASYEALGGLEQALATHADEVFRVLTTRERDRIAPDTFRRLFTRLAAFGDGPSDIRRVARRAELTAPAWALAQQLAGEDNRLVVTTTSEAVGDTVEIIHESLFRHWPRLAEWLEADRGFQLWLRAIAPFVDHFKANRDDDAPLLRGPFLAQARKWLAARPGPRAASR